MHPYAYWRRWIRLNNPNPSYKWRGHLEGGYEMSIVYDEWMIGGYYRIEIVRMRCWYPGYADAIRRSYWYQEDWIRSICRRWKTWARTQRILREIRAANTIRNFYYDYVVPRVYNPHTRGEGYLRLEAKMREINCD